MMALLYFLCCALLLAVPLATGSVVGLRFARNDVDQVDFTHHKLIRIKPSAGNHVAQLRKLEQDFEMDYWNPVLPDLRPVLTVVDPQREKLFLEALNASRIGYEIASSSFQEVVDEERAQMLIADRADFRNENFDYENRYHTYEQILQQIQFLANKYPSKAKYQPVGMSYEGREIPAIIIGSGSKVIFFECGIHSREWVTIAFGTWLSNKLLTDDSLAPLLGNYKFIIVPVLNVDGFVFTHTSNRLWRKTRSRQIWGCRGVDPNRNWNSAFKTVGISRNPCAETYCGSSPFSEVEVKQMSELISNYASQTVAYFALHNYSELWMYPWGYKYDSPPNAAKLKSIAQAGLAAIRATHGRSFTEGSIANAIYPASGSSIDWAYDTAKIPIAFAIELRDRGQYGFRLPANQIKPACEETWAGIQAAIENLD